MTNAQASLEFLQTLTMECPKCEGKLYSFIHPLDGEVEAECPTCQDARTVPKYPALWIHQTPLNWSDVELGELLMDAAKWRQPPQPRPAWGTKDEEPMACIGWYTGLFIEKHEVYTTPIEAALVALARAEGMEEAND